jgi:long-chain acyl-CoA synthetase
VSSWILRDERQALSRGDLAALSEALIEALSRADLGPDRRIAVFADNAVETLIVHTAALRAGCSPVPVNSRLTVDEVAYILGDSGARAVFVGPETAGRAAEAVAACAGPGVDIAVIGWRCPPTVGTDSAAVVPWMEWAPGGRRPPEPVSPRPGLLYTSGTTGRPKGTEMSPGSFPRVGTVEELVALARTGPFGQHGPHLVVGPLHHVGPLVTAVRALVSDLPVVILGGFDPERTLAAIEEHRIAATVMVPTHFVRLLAVAPGVRARYDLSSLRYVLHTGASCPPDVKRQMIAWWGPVIHEVYGASEVGTTCAIDSEEWLAHPGSVGRAVPPFEALIVDESGRALPPNTEGRLYFRDASGRGVVYHNDPAQSAAAHLSPGVFTLGEVGYLDDDGFIYITDRFSDMVVSGGANIYPAESEHVLIGYPGVGDVACIGVPDPDLGERLIALIVPADPADPPDPGRLISFCRDRLAHYKCPRTAVTVASVGRTALGKVNKRALRDRYLGEPAEVR